MRERRGFDELVEAIYDAALDSAGWPATVELLRVRFRSVCEAFYFHDDARKAVHPIHNGGIAPAFVQSYAELASALGYPWDRAPPLRRLGVLRTEARLVAFTGDPLAMRGTDYFNDWMRPQRLEHSIGITLLQEGGFTAKMTLLRPDGDNAFEAAEERDFLHLATHMRRALSVSRRFDLLLTRQSASFAALDAVPYGVMLLEPDGRIAYCNAIAESWMEQRDGLRSQAGRLSAADPRDEARLEALLHGTTRHAGTPDSIALRRAGGRRLVLSAVRLSAERRLLVTAQAAVLLLITDPDTLRGNDIELVRRLYGLTEAETQLAAALLAGDKLREAADASGIAYETARWHLKALFQKTDTRRQAELVARLLRDIAAVPLV